MIFTPAPYFTLFAAELIGIVYAMVADNAADCLLPPPLLLLSHSLMPFTPAIAALR